MRNLRTSLLDGCRCMEASVSLALLMHWSGPVLAKGSTLLLPFVPEMRISMQKFTASGSCHRREGGAVPALAVPGQD